MVQTATAEKAEEEQDLMKEPDLASLEAGLDEVLVDTELPEEYEMEVDAADRLNLVASYNRMDISLRAAKNTGQQEKRVNEATQEKAYFYGQLQRLDLKWQKRGRLSAFRSLMREIAKAQAKQTSLRRDEFLK